MSMAISIGSDDDRTDDDLDDVAGRGSGDGDGSDDEQDREDRRPSKGQRDSQENDAEDDEDDDRSPDELRAEIRRLKESLKKSNSTGLRRRNQLKELRAATRTLATSDDEDDDPDDDDDDDEPGEKSKQQKTGLDARAVQRRIDKAKKQARAEAEAAFNKDLIDTRAESALARAGADEKAIRLLKRELDYDDLELLQDRTVDGLDEEVDRLKSEFPNLFGRSKSGRRRINGGDDRTGGSREREVSASAKQARALRGR